MAQGDVHIQVSNDFFRPASGEVWRVGNIAMSDFSNPFTNGYITFTNNMRFSNGLTDSARLFVTRDNYLKWRQSRSEKVYQSYVQWK